MKILWVLGLVSVGVATVSCGNKDEGILGTELSDGVVIQNPGFLALPLTAPGKQIDSSITLANFGKEQLVISSITLSGQDTSVFQVGQPSTLTANPRDSLAIPVTFKPTTEGAFVANVHIASNDTGIADFIVDLLGPAGDNTKGSPAKLYAADKTVDANVDDGQNESRGVLRYYNVGEESLIVTAYSFDGASKASFSLADGTPIPGGACTANGLECGDVLFCLVRNFDPDGDGVPNSNAPGKCALSVPTADPIVLDIFYNGTGTGTATFSITPTVASIPAHPGDAITYTDGTPTTVTCNGSR